MAATAEDGSYRAEHKCKYGLYRHQSGGVTNIKKTNKKDLPARPEGHTVTLA